VKELIETTSRRNKIFPIRRGSIRWYGWYEHIKWIKNNKEI